MFRSTAGGGGLREGTVDVPSSSLLVVVGVAVPSYNSGWSGERWGERERERESEIIYMYVCVCVWNDCIQT